MYNFILNKINLQIMKITMFNLKNNYGYTTYSIIKKEAILHHIFIDTKYRRNNLGSVLLQGSEKIILKNHNIDKIKLLAHEKQGTNSLSNFYLKNGYTEFYEKNNKYNKYYDDGVYIYTLTPFYKKIKLST